MIFRISLLLIVAIWIMPSAFAQNRKLQTKTINTTIFGMPAKQTASYYIDNKGEMVLHGKTTVSGSMNNSRGKASVTEIITFKDDEPIGPCSITYTINNSTGKISGQTDEDGMAGTWTVSNIPGTNNIKSASFTIKDRRIVKLNAIGFDGTTVDLSSDVQGRLSGNGNGLKFKNGIVTNCMKNKQGKEITEFSPKAKAMIDELKNREVSSEELEQNGFYLDETDMEFFNLYLWASLAIECFSEEMPIDKELNKPNYGAVLCEIGD